MNAETVLSLPAETGFHVVVHSSFDQVEEVWRALETDGICYGFQCFDWIRHWYSTVGVNQAIEPQIAVVTSPEGATVMLLPLGIARSGMLRRLMWMGGKLSDYHGPLLSRSLGREFFQQNFRQIWEQVRAALPVVDAVTLEKLPETIGDLENPFRQLPCQLHPSATHQARLEDSLKAFVKSKRSNKSVATDRRKERRLAEQGEIRFVVASEPDERQMLLDALFRQKSEGYRALGVSDLFARADHREFIASVCAEMGSSKALLCGLTVGDRVAATCFSLVHGGRLYYLLPAYERDELTRFGPGNVLLYRLFEWCFDHDVTVFDFTLGDEPYKFFWSDSEMHMYDHFEGSNLRGSVYVAMLKISLRLKTWIKQSPRLLKAMLTLRQLRSRF